MSTRKLRFTWDSRGSAVVVRAPPPNDVLADYLSEELQPGSGAAERLLELILQVRSGHLGGWEVPGDCWSVELTKVRATVRTEDAIPGRTLHLPVEDFEEAVRAWQDFVRLPRASAS
ncbi:hypothetical protein HPC49_38340 [Pyxidicoccus fallax]|uniref:YacL family protein n=1 Tax=Pyxidicoccus fallax TaxID=394095 RepID=A0A848LWW5_9BACT|nr:hypothetical protein [Pyxidicoccus fallax]NMO22276.1 YacL family protein [Pyxidicoccus fallax]NPC84061.1 hypothetical protein [Pyxidicoccus fallax]